MKKYNFDKKCIAILGKKIVIENGNERLVDYILKRIILYGDFLDGKLQGYYYDGGIALYLNEDTKSFYIKGYEEYNILDSEHKERLEYNIDGCSEFFDSLKAGDVITFDLKGFIYTEKNYNDGDILCKFEPKSIKITNPEKYPDQLVAEKILNL